MPDSYSGGWSNPNDFGGPTGYGGVEVGGYGADQTGADLGDDDLGATDTDPGPGINSGPSSVSHSGPDAGAAAGMANSGQSDFGGVGGGGTGSGGSGCFITTAVVEAMDKPDNCKELTTLRWFRDNVMSQSEEGRTRIKEYYATAPTIVSEINKRTDSKVIWKGVYSNYIAPSVIAVSTGSNILAEAIYTNMVRHLAKLSRKGQ